MHSHFETCAGVHSFFQDDQGRFLTHFLKSAFRKMQPNFISVSRFLYTML